MDGLKNKNPNIDQYHGWDNAAFTFHV